MDMKKYQPVLVGAVLGAFALYGLSWYGSTAERAISAQLPAFYGNPRRAKARRGTGKLTNTERYPWAATLNREGKRRAIRVYFNNRSEAEEWVKASLASRGWKNVKADGNPARTYIDFFASGERYPVANVTLAAKWL